MRRFPAVMVLVALLSSFFSGAPRAASCGAENARLYQGPLFDAMAQIDAGMEGTVLEMMKRASVSRMAIFGRSKSKGSGAGDVDALVAAHPDVFVRGSPKIFDARGDLPSAYVRTVLEGVASGRYRFVGEILYAHGDKARGEQTADGERYVDPSAPGTRKLLAGLAGRSAPLMAHWEVYDWTRDWPLMHALYGEFPRQVFIWPHLGFGSVAQAETVLSSHPNVVATLSKKEGYAERSFSDRGKAAALGSAFVTDGCETLDPGWKAFLARYADRLMFATDAHKAQRWSEYPRIAERWRRILAQLPPEVAAKLAYGNADRLYR